MRPPQSGTPVQYEGDAFMEVTLSEMLEAREKRARRQNALLTQYRRPLVSFTMNIAGPVKDSPLIRRGFQIGLRDLEQLLIVERITCLHREELAAHTGCEAILVADAPAKRLKELTTRLEEYSGIGRLFDMDVLTPSGEKLGRAVPRRCLICGRIAQNCARNRTHSVAELQEKTYMILADAVDAEDRRFAAQMAQRALLYEIGITPKPGLVDRSNNGSHRDMDFFTFQRSAVALYPFFEECVRIGRETRSLSPSETFARLRFPGKLAEGRMLAATGGVNTHKGAIFSLGILCGALGRLEREDWCDLAAVLTVCADMCADLTADIDRPVDTAGTRLYRDHGITGARGQAAAGYPVVLQFGLPKLAAGLSEGLSINDAACAALLSLIAETTDTNMIHRGGLEKQQETAKAVAALLEKTPFPDRGTLEQLDADFIRDNLSPGGCADLLTMTLVLHFLKEDGGGASPTPPAES